MDPSDVIKEIGGGLTAVVIVALALANIYQYLRNTKREDQLVNKLLEASEKSAAQAREMHEKTLSGISALTTATEANTKTAQSAITLLERERRQ